VGFSAPRATSVSENSATIPPSFDGRPTTSLEPWIIWCGLNAEQEAIAAALGDRAFSVTGSMSPEEKVRLLYAWIDGERPVMISKTSILGMGVNMQRCANMAFVGLNDSWEQYYQAIRRCWRYGQTRPVNAHVVLSQLEGQIAGNIQRKERQTSRMVDSLVTAMHTEWSDRA
jgi:superfamily II DNA helicase RecQ